MPKKYTIWILLAGLALVGSVTVQSVWIAQGYQQAQDHLQDQLESALTHTIDDLMLAEEIAFISSIDDEAGGQVMEYHFIQDTSMEWKHEDIKEGELDSLGFTDLEELEVNVIGDEIPSEGGVRIEVISQVDQEDLDTTIHEEDAALEDVLAMERSGRLNAVMRRIKVENIRRSGDWKNRIDSARIHEALQENLTEEAIAMPFTFEVTNKEGKRFKDLSMQRDSTKSGVTAKAPLFPADLRSKNIFLNVHLQAGFGDVFKEVGVLAGFSGLFTLTMLLLFIGLWRKLLSQERLSQMKSNFIGNMSHELRTPLATISLAADSIVHPNSITDLEETKALVATIKKEHNRILQHVDRVLQMAHADHEGFPLERGELKLEEWLSTVVEPYLVRAAEEEKEFKMEIPSEECVVQWDELHMRSALENLIDNAFNYNPKGSRITVLCRVTEDTVSIDVVDDGVGISKEDQRSVFERFYRVEGGNIHSVKGFGLGLNYVQLVAEAHGGSLELESTLGKGSTFTLNLPIHG